MINITENNHGLRFEVKVQPRSAQNAIAGVQTGMLKVKLHAPPVEGEANKALISFLADRLGVPRKNLAIIKGEHHRQKTVEITGTSKAELVEKLKPYMSG